MKDLILGIDPGLTGALAFYAPDRDHLEVHDMPVLRIGSKNVIDEYALARLIDNVSEYVSAAWIEQVGVRPGEGAVGAFTFGKGYGLLRGVCASCFLPMHDVTPATWKRALRVSGDKDEARQRASALLPRHGALWPLKKHDGRAEAALIAVYGSAQAQRVAA